MTRIYKILTEGEWRQFRQAGRYEGSAIDLADGYIHFSTASQVAETLAKHYAGQSGLILLAIEVDRLPGPALRHEPARGGQLFPHLYAALALAAVSASWPLPLDAYGRHCLPGLSA